MRGTNRPAGGHLADGQPTSERRWNELDSGSAMQSDALRSPVSDDLEVTRLKLLRDRQAGDVIGSLPSPLNVGRDVGMMGKCDCRRWEDVVDVGETPSQGQPDSSSASER